MPEVIDLEGLVFLLTGSVDRGIIAIAGPPGAGKSTLAKALCDRMNKGNPGYCEVLPMDGFHYDDTYLGPMGWQARKGAPHTFDVEGFQAMLARLKANKEAEIAVPVFDRELEIARAGARMISQDAGLIIVEGNYLLLNKPPWVELRPFFDITVMLEVPVETLKARLKARWAEFGYSKADAEAKIAQNDLLNIQEVIKASITADYLVKTGG